MSKSPPHLDRAVLAEENDQLRTRIAELEVALAASEHAAAASMAAQDEHDARTQEGETQRQALERALHELRAAQIELTHSQKLSAIGQLAAGIAHEINTPIQYVGDNLTYLQKVFEQILPALQAVAALASGGDEARDRLVAVLGKLKLPRITAQVPRAIEQSLDGIGRVGKIVGAMKDFSHPSAGEMAEVDLRHTIESTVTIARNEWKYVAELTIDIPPDLPPVVCLRDELNQVILNLVVNAAHAIGGVVVEGGPRGTIHISAAIVDGWCEIRVADTGTGIPAELHARIFEPFFTTKPVGKGTGQGLAIAYAVVVEKHCGTLTFESELGRGTTFIIRIPNRQSPRRSEAA